eukprot:1466645-Amphidinium_carterae.1
MFSGSGLAKVVWIFHRNEERGRNRHFKFQADIDQLKLRYELEGQAAKEAFSRERLELTQEVAAKMRTTYRQKQTNSQLDFFTDEGPDSPELLH